jgi:hypothetical protein
MGNFWRKKFYIIIIIIIIIINLKIALKFERPKINKPDPTLKTAINYNNKYQLWLDNNL